MIRAYYHHHHHIIIIIIVVIIITVVVVVIVIVIVIAIITIIGVVEATPKNDLSYTLKYNGYEVSRVWRWSSERNSSV